MRGKHRLAGAVVAFALSNLAAACSRGHEGPIDSGPGAFDDAGTSARDAGTPAIDARAPGDTGLAPRADSGTTMDAGTELDAATEADAGIEIDAGTLLPEEPDPDLGPDSRPSDYVADGEWEIPPEIGPDDPRCTLHDPILVPS